MQPKDPMAKLLRVTDRSGVVSPKKLQTFVGEVQKLKPEDFGVITLYDWTQSFPFLPVPSPRLKDRPLHGRRAFKQQRKAARKEHR